MGFFFKVLANFLNLYTKKNILSNKYIYISPIRAPHIVKTGTKYNFKQFSSKVFITLMPMKRKTYTEHINRKIKERK